MREQGDDGELRSFHTHGEVLRCLLRHDCVHVCTLLGTSQTRRAKQCHAIIIAPRLQHGGGQHFGIAMPRGCRPPYLRSRLRSPHLPPASASTALHPTRLSCPSALPQSGGRARATSPHARELAPSLYQPCASSRTKELSRISSVSVPQIFGSAARRAEQRTSVARMRPFFLFEPSPRYSLPASVSMRSRPLPSCQIAWRTAAGPSAEMARTAPS